MAKILIVEDDEKLARYIELELLHEGYEVEKSGNGSEAFEIICRNAFDLVLLDVMLPGINGMEVLRRIHLQAQGGRELRNVQDDAQAGIGEDGDTESGLSGKQGFEAPPVILLTARDAVMDKVAGLDAGAADYITKPFAIEELLARIRVALKLHPRAAVNQVSNKKTQHENGGAAGCLLNDSCQGDEQFKGREKSDSQEKTENQDAGGSSSNQSDQDVRENENHESAKLPDHIITWHDLTMDLHKYRVTYAGDEITLTNREFLMLKCLLENRDIVMGRDTLLSKVCGYDYVGETNVVDVYIRYLRSKIDDAYKIKMIHTVRGVGYVIYE